MGNSLKILAAKAEITDLIHTYALNIRNRAPQANASLFTADASFETREAHPLKPETLRQRSRAEGHAAVMGSIGSSTATHRVFPQIHNLIVKVDGEAASATSLMVGTVFPGGSQLIGEYEDHFRREDGQWLFSSRCYTIYREG